MNHKPRSKLRHNSKVDYRKVTNHDKGYFPSHTLPVEHPSNRQKYLENNFLNPPQIVTHQPEGTLWLLKWDFSEGQFDKEIEANSPYQEDSTEQEYGKPKDNIIEIVLN